MTERLFLYEGGGFDPCVNLAVERCLLEAVPEGACVLYLWQNENTVVVGRNQNIWKECRVTRMEHDGVTPVRRLSGGGAVFHDLGNLNFTFLLPTEDYDLARQTEVILSACRALGIPAERTGRNDLTADGRKFSGQAFYHSRGRSYHHGTLLVSADLEKMGRYLRPDEAKLRARGVDSVSARVVDLASLRPGLTVADMREALCRSFEAVCGRRAERLTEDVLDKDALSVYTAQNRSWDWVFGRELPFDWACEGRFDWGGLRLELSVEGGVVRRVSVQTDAMDWTLAETLEAALTGCRFSLPALCERVSAMPDVGEDLRLLLSKQDL